MPDDTAALVDAYYAAWGSGDFDRVGGDRISRIDLYFDPSPFMQRSAG